MGAAHSRINVGAEDAGWRWPCRITPSAVVTRPSLVKVPRIRRRRGTSAPALSGCRGTCLHVHGSPSVPEMEARREGVLDSHSRDWDASAVANRDPHFDGIAESRLRRRRLLHFDPGRFGSEILDEEIVAGLWGYTPVSAPAG